MTSRLFTLFVAVFVAFVGAVAGQGLNYSVDFTDGECSGTVHYLGEGARQGYVLWEVEMDSLPDDSVRYVIRWNYEYRALVRYTGRPSERVLEWADTRAASASVGGVIGHRSDLIVSEPYLQDQYYNVVQFIKRPTIIRTPRGPTIRCRPAPPPDR